MEAKKSHDLSSASWRTGKAGDKIQSKSKGLGTKSTNVQEQKMYVPAQTESKLDLPLPFCPIHALSGLNDALPHWWGTSSSLSLPMPTLIFSWNALTDTSKNVLPAIWASPSLFKLRHKLDHHTYESPRGILFKMQFCFGRCYYFCVFFLSLAKLYQIDGYLQGLSFAKTWK